MSGVRKYRGACAIALGLSLSGCAIDFGRFSGIGTEAPPVVSELAAEPAAFEPPEVFASDAEIRAEGFHQNALAAEASGNRFAAIGHDLQALDAFADHAGARQHLAKIRRQLAPKVDVLIEEGRTHFRNEDLQSALDSWQRALLIDPSNERAQAYAARAVRQLENLERLRSEPDVASGER